MVLLVARVDPLKAFLQAGHELVEVNGVNVRDIPRSELERPESWTDHVAWTRPGPRFLSNFKPRKSMLRCSCLKLQDTSD